MESKVLVVLGMHRSGTSLVANWLHESGITMGNELLPPTPNNALGHFEDLDFFLFQEKIMTQSSLPYHIGLHDKITIDSNHQEEASEILDRKKSESQWGWKDPRTCLFLDFWSNLLHSQGYKPKYIIVYRPVEQVIDSLIRRDINRLRNRRNKLSALINIRKYNKKISTKHVAFLNSWIRYYSDIKRFQEMHPEDCLVISPFQLAEDHVQVKDFLEKNWGFQLKDVDINAIFRSDLIKKTEAVDRYTKAEVQQLHEYFTSRIFQSSTS